MLNYLPKYISTRAIVAYFVALVLCSFVFLGKSLDFFFMFTGALSVTSFFYLSNTLTIQWQTIRIKTFTQKIFIIGFIVRVCWVVFSYFYYIKNTGQPFEFMAADSMGYHGGGINVKNLILTGSFSNWDMFQKGAYSDSGFMLILGLEYIFTDDSIFWARIINALFSAYMSVLIYKIAKNNFGESTGRIAGIAAMLMPNFIYYCGLHAKETIMILLTVLFIERIDNILRNKDFKLLSIVPAMFVGLSLFLFRTVLGVTAFISVLAAILLASSKKTKWGNRLALGFCATLFIFNIVGSKIMYEIETVWEQKGTNQQIGMEGRAQRKGGNVLAKYATKSIFIPLIFTIPFPTLVNSNQPNQQIMNGANFAKNIMSFFVIFGLLMLLRKNKWREHLLIISFLLGYLAVIGLSNFAHSERFHMPSLPFALIIASWGISQFTNRQKTWFDFWVVSMVIAAIGWNYIKLKGRGLT
ncbi:MAG: glycosyltransferase family 39 protein [Prevotellaceae bacterium]|nr:glycosyltransferase family 39 protein [Prevotellaceae bacterium]